MPELLIVGQKILSVKRHGKFIVFELEDGNLISHLRMTGQWRFELEYNQDTYDRWGFELYLSDGQVGFLIFRDIRKFGTLEWVKNLRDHSGYASLGPDGLSIVNENIQKQIAEKAAKSKRSIKNFLLDQTVLAGVGNIYCCESLWMAKIDPRLLANECVEYIPEICKILWVVFHQAIAMRGSSISDYEGGSYHEILKVYGRAGKPCVRCGDEIKKMAQAGRSTFYCPTCQGVVENEVS